MICMAISRNESGTREGFAPQVPQNLMRTILYLELVAVALLGCVFGFQVTVVAQEERPQIFPGERKPKNKKDAGPRSVAVLQMAANGKASLVPVAIMVNGKFYDASAYKADPVPMALESGTVYEGERTGSSLGLFTVSSALHSNASNVQAPWIGTGQWLPTGTESAHKGMKAESAPVGLDTSEGPPRLTKDPNAVKQVPAGTKQPASSSPPAQSSPPSGSSSGDEPPRLNKPASSGESGSGHSAPTASAPSSSPTKAPDDSKSGSKSGDTKDTKADSAKADAAAKIPASDSGASEENRPKLRRGKPVESFADEEVPGYSKPGAAPPDKGKVVVAAATAGPVDVVPAISDAGGPEPRSFGFQWIQGEEADRRQQMMDLAKQKLRAYLEAQAKAKITPASAGPKGAGPKGKQASKKPVEPIFGTMHMAAYDLWTNNQPVIVFSADAHLPAPPEGTPQSGTQTELQYWILLMAYPDIYGNLRVIHAAVTDKYHYDITPKLDLVDVVDADGDGRGELLFKKTSDAGTGWAIYRAGADKLWKVFDSLNPE